MAKLQEKNFNKHFIEEAKIAAGTYLFECLSDEEQERCRKEWDAAGGKENCLWYLWCLDKIKVTY